MNPIRFLLLAYTIASSTAWAGSFTDTEQSSRLYTKPDPSAKGGIRVAFSTTDKPSGVFALLQTDANRCYQARPDGDGWLVTGLPVGKYDLFVVFDDRFYEGLLLSREPDSLTAADHKSILTIITNSIPFFDTKKIHRSEGVTGKGGKCAIVLQEVRTRPVLLQSFELRTDIQIRSLKMGFLEEVNIGWQLVNTREVMRIEVGGDMPKGVIPHRHVPPLGNIRVTDAVKDLGTIQLK